MRGKLFLFSLIGMLPKKKKKKSNNEHYLSQHISIFSMVMWKLKANLVLNFSNYIPLLFFHIIVCFFFKKKNKHLPLLQLYCNKLFKNQNLYK